MLSIYNLGLLIVWQNKAQERDKQGTKMNLYQLYGFLYSVDVPWHKLGSTNLHQTIKDPNGLFQWFDYSAVPALCTLFLDCGANQPALQGE